MIDRERVIAVGVEVDRLRKALAAAEQELADALGKARVVKERRGLSADILRALVDGSLTSNQIARKMGGVLTSVRPLLWRLVQLGDVARVGSTRPLRFALVKR